MSTTWSASSPRSGRLQEAAFRSLSERSGWGAYAGRPARYAFSWGDTPSHISGAQLESLELVSPEEMPIHTWRRTYLHVWVPLFGGPALVGMYSTRYYAASPSAREGRDICYYCGADNGPAGRDRVGYDCFQCGGN